LAGQVEVNLPNGINAVVDVVKLRDCCLKPGTVGSEMRPRGRMQLQLTLKEPVGIEMARCPFFYR
jgi:hypothetical protein